MIQVLRWIFANPGLKLVSVGFAVGVWLYVQGSEIEETRLPAQVVWSLPTNLVAVVPPPTSVTLQVRGTRAALRVARTGMVRMVVDVSNATAGPLQVDLSTVPVEGLPKTLERAGVVPSVVDLALDPRVLRRLAVSPNVVGEPADGFAVTSVSIEPERIEIVGPKATVDGLSRLSTRPIDVAGLAVTTMRPVELDLPLGVTPTQDGGVAARIEVISRIERREIANVPVFVKGSDRFVAAPGHVTVSVEGPASDVGRLDAERVAAFVVLPASSPKDRYEAWLGPRDGVRIEVLHGGGALVKVTAVAPPSVVVEAR